MTPNKDDLHFAAEMSCLYHQRRSAFLGKADLIINWLTVVSSASAFLFLFGGNNAAIVQVLSAVIALLSITQIVCGVGRAAVKHEQWYAEWRDLLAEIQTTVTPKQAQLNDWIRRRTEIEKQYPNELEALGVDCRNQVIVALGLDETELRVIRWWQKPILQLFSLQTAFPPRTIIRK